MAVLYYNLTKPLGQVGCHDLFRGLDFLIGLYEVGLPALISNPDSAVKGLHWLPAPIAESDTIRPLAANRP